MNFPLFLFGAALITSAAPYRYMPMKKALVLFTFLSMFFMPLRGQKHDYLWLLGQWSPAAEPPHYNFFFNFSSFPPLVAIDSNITQFFAGEGLALSDSSGNLQFYSTGCRILNPYHDLMEGGDSLNFGDIYDVYCPPYYPLFQGMLSIPQKNIQYDIFHFRLHITDELVYPSCTVRELLRTRVNMAANQGAGKVIQKNELILTGCFQTVWANRHANGRDWWLLLGDNKVDTFYRFLVTPDSLLGPWMQAIENPSVDSFYFCGWANFSPDGSKFVINGCRSGVAVYDFDRCSGLLSGLRFAPRPEWEYTWGAAFSPNNRYLYVDMNDNRHFVQFDLIAPDLAASQTIVAIWDGYLTPWSGGTVFGPSCLGPDGKIYIGTHGFAHVVEYPDLPGAASKVIQRSIESPAAGQIFTPYHPNYRLGPLDNSPCDTLGLDNLPVALFRHEVADTLDPLTLQFTDLSWYEPTAWYWTFGDGTASQDSCPLHTFPGPGLYTVCLVASNAYASDTLCQQIEVGEVSGVHGLPALPLAQVAPNPFGDRLLIRLPARVALAPRFVLYDALGRLRASAVLRDFETALPAAHLPAGMYFWQLQYGGRAVQAGRIVKAGF